MPFTTQNFIIYTTKLPHFIAYALHRTKLHSSMTHTALLAKLPHFIAYALHRTKLHSIYRKAPPFHYPCPSPHKTSLSIPQSSPISLPMLFTARNFNLPYSYSNSWTNALLLLCSAPWISTLPWCFDVHSPSLVQHQAESTAFSSSMISRYPVHPRGSKPLAGTQNRGLVGGVTTGIVLLLPVKIDLSGEQFVGLPNTRKVSGGSYCTSRGFYAGSAASGFSTSA
ncbi:uncharacterized protein EDB93DRAFT_1254395 [Suillus bovinus]|uniref:uncharacterized protein n=1 Tax=Suillus bovinus TaxID=48563 RepID=UPI001B8796AF|nr:uncharacterized protein EDB93DRAFT_1254395 [Suillus bovinus]KAG2134889.1 hypothetical protein EDB93DRAFT_1254395 [Suillus bovinus]